MNPRCHRDPEGAGWGVTLRTPVVLWNEVEQIKKEVMNIFKETIDNMSASDIMQLANAASEGKEYLLVDISVFNVGAIFNFKYSNEYPEIDEETWNGYDYVIDVDSFVKEMEQVDADKYKLCEAYMESEIEVLKITSTSIGREFLLYDEEIEPEEAREYVSLFFTEKLMSTCGILKVEVGEPKLAIDRYCNSDYCLIDVTIRKSWKRIFAYFLDLLLEDEQMIEAYSSMAASYEGYASLLPDDIMKLFDELESEDPDMPDERMLALFLTLQRYYLGDE